MRRTLFFLFMLFGLNLFAQNNLSSDELFLKAKDAAFNKKDRKLARSYCKQALKRSPNYSDISVFLGRLYTWDNYNDSARVIFNKVMNNDPRNEDAFLAAIDLEYWADNPNAALIICKRAITLFPNSAELLLKKAKVEDDLKEYDEAFKTLETIFKKNKANSEALVFAARLQEKVVRNSIAVSYEYDHFDKTFDPWHLGSISYSRRTPIGTAIFRTNFARRFEENGTQYEIEMYPRFANGLYAYLNAGYSKDDIYPKNRYGASLYISLPLSFEIDGGFRLLKFNTETWIYTFALGKYWGNYWFSLRTFITPQIQKASHSYSLTARYYLSSSEDYLALTVGTGISPSEGSIDMQGNWLTSNKAGMEYHKRISKAIIISLSADYSREEYGIDNFRSKVSGNVSIKFLF